VKHVSAYISSQRATTADFRWQGANWFCWAIRPTMVGETEGQFLIIFLIGKAIAGIFQLP
jgi:hypothetical protein